MTTTTHLYDVCDLHCDSILKLQEDQDQNISSSLMENTHTLSLPKLQEGNVRVQTFALFTDRKNGHQPEHEALRLLNQFQKQLEQCADSLILIRTQNDLKRVLEQSKVGALLSLEEGDICFQDLDLLEFWARMGVRIIALTWNYPNAIASPNISFEDLEDYDYHTPSPLFRLEKEKGLTEFGRAYVQKCEELGILVDVSHLGDKGFWDVINLSTRPVIASHSNCRSLCPVSRNLDDDQIRAIARTGGVIGLNFCADFLKENDDDISHISDMVAHLNHLKATGGISVCAIGTDYDGIHSKVEICDPSRHQLLADALAKDGWSHEEIALAMGGNVLNLLMKTLKEIE